MGYNEWYQKKEVSNESDKISKLGNFYYLEGNTLKQSDKGRET